MAKKPAQLFVAALAALSLVSALALPAAAQDRQHQWLARAAGDWSVTQSFWTAPDQAPKIDKGQARFDMVLNQRHLRQTLRIDDARKFEGLGYIGYDDATGRFFSTWMDVNFSGLVLANGALDANDASLVLKGQVPSSEGPGQTAPIREVLTIVDADHMRYEFFETHKGAEFLAVRLDYARTR